MNWRDVPSLVALRAFEAAARAGSYSEAARDLNVTHAAIAQHVRSLEDHFSTRLMQRSGNGMALTPEGQILSRSLGEAFGLIEAACRDLLDTGTTRPLRIALTPSFAANWLMPRIGRFWEKHPEIALELLPGVRRVDLRADGVDLAIRYGRGPWAGTESRPLMSAGHVVVGDPKRHAEVAGRTLADLRGQTWLMDRVMNEERLWASANGVDLETETVRLYDTADLAREAAKAGIGVAILPEPIVAGEIASGRLMRLYTDIESPIAYHVLTRPGTVHPTRDTFIRWLDREAARP